MTRLIRCRSCGSDRITDVFSFGDTPLANRLLKPEEIGSSERRYPLELAFCRDCTLLQITQTVPAEELFSDYVYFSSFSDLVVANARENVERVLSMRRLGAEDLVVEIASNDGYLLQHYRQQGVPVVGIEPAANIAAVARERGIETIVAFFSEATGERLAEEGLRASVLHAHNVLAHVDDLNGFVRGIARILRPDGIAVIEVPYLLDLIDQCEFDTIYHEHLCYYSVTALQALFSRNGMHLADLQHVPIHGGTLRLTLTRAGAAAATPAVDEFLQREKAWGVAEETTYLAFSSRVHELKRDLLTFLDKLRAQGARIAAYGASAKGATLLNWCGIGRSTIAYVIDRSTAKQGLLTPGTHLPIVAPEMLLEDFPSHLLLLAWNHAEEILRQQTAYRDRGGRFIIPIPRPIIV